MANNVSDKAKNIAADAMVAASIETFLHDSSVPNGDGANNRINAVPKTLAAGRFGSASGGTVETANAEGFGVLSTTQSNTVMAISARLASDDGFLWEADMTADVAVGANEQFEMDAGGIGFDVT